MPDALQLGEARERGNTILDVDPRSPHGLHCALNREFLLLPSLKRSRHAASLELPQQPCRLGSFGQPEAGLDLRHHFSGLLRGGCKPRCFGKHAAAPQLLDRAEGHPDHLTVAIRLFHQLLQADVGFQRSHTCLKGRELPPQALLRLQKFLHALVHHRGKLSPSFVLITAASALRDGPCGLLIIRI